MSCWHCQDSKACSCIVCGFDALVDGVVGRQSGKCLACKGREYHQHYMALLQRYDPSVRENWVHHPASDGNKGWKEYIPFKGLQ